MLQVANLEGAEEVHGISTSSDDEVYDLDRTRSHSIYVTRPTASNNGIRLLLSSQKDFEAHGEGSQQGVR